MNEASPRILPYGPIKAMIKVGERVVVCGWALPVTVSRIYAEDAHGKETEDADQVALWMLELDWGPELGRSRVKLHEEGKTWYRYSKTN